MPSLDRRGVMASSIQNQLSQGMLSSLAARGDVRTFARGAMLITEGEMSDALYILIAGELRVFTRDERGRELVYNVLGPGEFFGEMFLDGGPRSASVKAVCTSMCVVIGPDELRRFMQGYPEFAECLVLKLIERVRHATEQARQLALNGVYERAVALLNELAIDDGHARAIRQSLTQQEIANRIGATREMVNLILRDLTRGGFLIRDGERGMVLAKELPKHW